MSVTLALDYAFRPASISAIVATGAKSIGRYLSHTAGKNITGHELAAYRAADLSVFLVWETTAGRALGTWTDGHTDAMDARTQADQLGLPPDQPIHFAVDTSATWAQVAAYAAGWRNVIGGATGVYGDYSVMAGAHAAGIRFLWQTRAWSNGLVYPAITILQTGATLLGGRADVDRAFGPDWGQYPRPAAPPAPPAAPEGDLDMFVHAATAAPATATAAEVVKDAIYQVGPGTRFWIGPRAYANIAGQDGKYLYISEDGFVLQANWPQLLGRGI